MSLFNESDAELSPGGRALPMVRPSGNLDPRSSCAVRDWVRHGRSVPVESVPLASIRRSFSPRKTKTSQHHVTILAQSPLPLPPIVIHRASMRVIDGVHRLRATQLRGGTEIAARFFDGDDAQAFALAVLLNVTHGLPLTLEERKAAAQRVLGSCPHWSDRSIALIAGVSNKTVGKLRVCATEEVPQLGPRLGRDGRNRPVTPAAGRRRAAAFLSMKPSASLREIARAAGVSVNTARDVRRRIDNGENPVPDKLAKLPALPEVRGNDLLQRLRNDPAVRSSERGRALLRLLSTVVVAISACNEFAGVVPNHCSGTIAEIARKNARAWQEVADKFES
jgi:ParB-like chromosome segregation protein Spo0J